MDLRYVGFINQHVIFSTDESNITSKNNSYIYNQVIMGNYQSPSFDYLNNLGNMRLNDIKSIGTYNETNLAARINNLKKNEEILDEEYTITLPRKFVKVKGNIVQALENRRSSRRFSQGYEMPLLEFSTIMHYSYGIAKRKMVFDDIAVTTRHYGSGGGLYPISVYVLVNNVEGLKKGIYKYQPFSHSLYYVNNSMDIRELLQHGSFDFDNYSFCVLYENDINRTYVKYGELFLLNSLIEVGLMCQNLDIITTSLNYGICQIAGFDKPYAEKVLGLDGVNSHIVFVNICGKE